MSENKLIIKDNPTWNPSKKPFHKKRAAGVKQTFNNAKDTIKSKVEPIADEVKDFFHTTPEDKKAFQKELADCFRVLKVFLSGVTIGGIYTYLAQRIILNDIPYLEPMILGSIASVALMNRIISPVNKPSDKSEKKDLEKKQISGLKTLAVLNSGLIAGSASYLAQLALFNNNSHFIPTTLSMIGGGLLMNTVLKKITPKEINQYEGKNFEDLMNNHRRVR